MITLHTVVASLATLLGLIIFSRPKGTVTHSWLGRSFVLFLLITDITALFIFHPSSSISVAFAVLALWNLVWVSLGIWYGWRKQPRSWLTRHYYFMAYAYLGLIAALVARIPLAFTPNLYFAAAVSVATVFGVGAWAVERNGKYSSQNMVPSR